MRIFPFPMSKRVDVLACSKKRNGFVLAPDSRR